MVFEQYNANAAPGSGPSCEIELRGTKGTMYVRNNTLGGRTREDHGGLPRRISGGGATAIPWIAAMEIRGSFKASRESSPGA